MNENQAFGSQDPVCTEFYSTAAISPFAAAAVPNITIYGPSSADQTFYQGDKIQIGAGINGATWARIEVLNTDFWWEAPISPQHAYIQNDWPIPTTARTGTYTAKYSTMNESGVTAYKLRTFKVESKIVQLYVNPSSWSLSAAGGSKSISIEANSSWTIKTNDGWLVPSTLSGSGSRSISIGALPNTDTRSRKGVVTVREGGLFRDIKVDQDGREAPQESVELTVSRSSWDAPLEGGRMDITVRSNSSWSAKSSHLWLTVSPYSGNYDDTITLSALSNKGMFTPRYATVTVRSGSKEREIEIYQPGQSNIVYLIRYDGNGGGGNSPTDQQVRSGESVALRDNRFTWSNHKFVGWSTSKSSSSRLYKEGEKYSPNQDTWMYAIWDQNAVFEKPKVETYQTVSITETGATFKGAITNYGGSTVTAHGFYYGVSPAMSSNPIRYTSPSTGGSFECVMNNLTPDTKYYVRAYAVNSAGTGSGSTLTFTTKAAYYNITYNANGGTGTAPASQRIAAGGSVRLRSNTFTKANYTFQGWSTSKGATSAAYSPNASFRPTGDTIMYAVWKEIILTIPTVVSKQPDGITQTKATLKGDITKNGGASITEYGFYYGNAPSTSDWRRIPFNRTTNGGVFEYEISGLNPGTRYYAMTYAINSVGTAYGSIVQFNTWDETSVNIYAPSSHGETFYQGDEVRLAADISGTNKVRLEVIGGSGFAQNGTVVDDNFEYMWYIPIKAKTGLYTIKISTLLPDGSIDKTDLTTMYVDAMEPTLYTNIKQWNPGAKAGNTSVSITSNVPWTVSSSASWVTTSLERGTGNKTFFVTIEPNTGLARNSMLIINSGGLTPTVIIIIKQAGVDAQTATVTFDANEGALRPGSPRTITVNIGGKLGYLPPNPTNGRHSFRGWFDTIEASGGRKMTVDTIINRSQTVWARWNTGVKISHLLVGDVKYETDGAVVEPGFNINVVVTVTSGASLSCYLYDMTDAAPGGDGSLVTQGRILDETTAVIPKDNLTEDRRYRIRVQAVLEGVEDTDDFYFSVHSFGAVFNDGYVIGTGHSSYFSYRDSVSGEHIEPDFRINTNEKWIYCNYPENIRVPSMIDDRGNPCMGGFADADLGGCYLNRVELPAGTHQLFYSYQNILRKNVTTDTPTAFNPALADGCRLAVYICNENESPVTVTSTNHSHGESGSEGDTGDWFYANAVQWENYFKDSPITTGQLQHDEYNWFIDEQISNQSIFSGNCKLNVEGGTATVYVLIYKNDRDVIDPRNLKLFPYGGVLEDGTAFEGDPNEILQDINGTLVDIADDFVSGTGDGFYINVSAHIKTSELEANSKLICTNYSDHNRNNIHADLIANGADLINLTRTATNKPVTQERANWCAMYHYNLILENDTDDIKVINTYVHAPSTRYDNENNVIINYDGQTKCALFTELPEGGVYDTWKWLTVALKPKTSIEVPFTCIWGTNSSNGLTHIFEVNSEVKRSDTFYSSEENYTWAKH